MVKWITRERILFAFGLGGFAHQLLVGPVNPWIIGACMLFTGVNGAQALVALLRPPQVDANTSPPSLPASPSSSPSPSSQS